MAKPYLERLWATKDASKSIRTITLGWMLWITSKALTWAMEFAEFTHLSGLEAAAVIGAVLSPLAILHAAIFKFYTGTAIVNVSANSPVKPKQPNPPRRIDDERG